MWILFHTFFIFIIYNNYVHLRSTVRLHTSATFGRFPVFYGRRRNHKKQRWLLLLKIMKNFYHNKFYKIWEITIRLALHTTPRPQSCSWGLFFLLKFTPPLLVFSSILNSDNIFVIKGVFAVCVLLHRSRLLLKQYIVQKIFYQIKDIELILDNSSLALPTHWPQ